MKVTLADYHSTALERRYVNEALASGRLSYGHFSRRFEDEFARSQGGRFGVLSNSGTSSLHVAVQAMKELYNWQAGDEVIVPAVTFVATVNVLLHNGLTPVLCDIDPWTYNINPVLAEKAITERTRAIMPVSLFGQPAALAYIQNLCQQTGLKMIHDSCESVGSKHFGRGLAAFGGVSCFSMYVAHLLVTGVGGIAVTDDPELAIKMRSLVNHGRDGIYMSADDDDNLDRDALHEVVSRRFNFTHIGHSFRITELEAALGCAQLEQWEQSDAKRTYNAWYLLRHLGSLEGSLRLPTTAAPNSHSWMMFPLLLNKGTSKWPLVNYLEDRGIETREMLRLTDQPCYAGRWQPADYPVSQWVNESGFYIPCHQHLDGAQLDWMIKALYDYFEQPYPDPLRQYAHLMEADRE